MASFQDMAATSFYNSQAGPSQTQQPTPDPSQLGASSAQTASASAAAASSQAGPSQPSRAQAEEARKDRTLAEFLLMLDEYEPLVRVPVSLCAERPGH